MIHQSNADSITFTDKDGQVSSLHFRSLVEWINEGIFCINEEGKILFANDQFCRNLGYTKAELLGQNIMHHFYSEEFIRLAKQKLEFRKKGLSDVYETKMRRKNGQGIWIRVNGKPFFDTKGKFVCSIGIHIDITKQKELEDELMFAKEDLESKVITRTRQLSEANQKLNQQIKEKRLAEVSLKNSDKRFKDIFINSPDAIYIESYDGVILDVNEATCKLHHTTAEFLLGKSIYDISPLHLHEQIKARQPKLISGEVSKFESECMTTTGEILPIEISVAHINFNEKPSLLVHVRDISDRKKNQDLLQQLNSELEEKVAQRTQEIQKQKEFLSQIIDASPGLVFVKDMGGKYLLINETMANYYNIDKDAMEGKRDEDFNFNAEELALFKKQDEQVLASGKQITFPEQRFRNNKTGQEAWLSVVKKTIPSLDGEGINILGVASDVTSLIRARRELRISDKLYREIARCLPKAALFIFDKNLRYTLAEGPLVGIISKPKEEIEGKTIYESIGGPEAEHIEKLYIKILSGETSEFEQDFFDRTLRIHHIPIQSDEGETIYGMVMAFDISDLKSSQQEVTKRNEALQRSNEELERFAYVASHDLQGPLRTIASYLQLLELRNRHILDKESKEFIDFSVSGAKRLQTLIQDLLAYSKISSSPKTFTKVSLVDIANVISKNLEVNIQQSGSNIEIRHLPTVLGDASQLIQLLQNLVENAMKFVKNGSPHIILDSKENEEEWCVSVTDNGIGIKEEFQDRIFQIFQRLHTDMEYSGTGVGLAICKKIVHLHGGRIWFESKPDSGTTFYFTITKKKASDKRIAES